ncbi:uncharacterized protein LOC143082550 [Mytilus galloprovincialis]|uniref:uncharacterized protein LOC143082550 n=1 Tax=Mytilus galloprovincialis TaxID=29158 RepID=UPI003F7C45C0
MNFSCLILIVLFTTAVSVSYENKIAEEINELEKELLAETKNRQILETDEQDIKSLNHGSGLNNKFREGGYKRHYGRPTAGKRNEINQDQTHRILQAIGREHDSRLSQLLASKKKDTKKVGRKTITKKGRKLNNKNKKGRKMGYIFDKPEDLNADSEFSYLLDAMSVDLHGHVYQPKGRHKDKKKSKGEDLERDPPVQLKRNFKSTFQSWQNGRVFYEIDAVFDAADRDIIESAVQEINDQTCLNWVPHDGTPDVPYIKIISGSGCWSYVGNMNYFPQELSLGTGCVNKPTAVHEMMHAIGSQHEQTRSDRDNYMTIIEKNIQSGREGNFQKQQTMNNHPLDAASDMMYGLYGFSINGDKTIKFNDWRLEFQADSATGLMFYDVADITTAYTCTASCGTLPSQPCLHGGFVDKTCTCKCPDVLTGEFCEQPINTDTCGGTIDLAAGETKILTSPNYPNNYDLGSKCTWLIKGVPENLIRATITDMEISNNDNACYHWIQIRYHLLGNMGPLRCGSTDIEDNEIWDTTVDEEMNTMIIIFDSDIGSDKAASKGFSMTLQSIGTGCVDYPCKHGKCDSALNTASYICTCDQGFSGTNCDVPSVYSVFSCTVEVGSPCMLVQEENDDIFDWETRSEPAPYSAWTGPKAAKEGNIYLYTKTWSKRIPNDTAIMYTDMDLPKVERCLSFWYHMYSYTASHMGTLDVYMSDDSGSTLLFTKSGNQGNIWRQAEIYIPAVDNLKLTFESITGDTTYMSDMAVDDIWLIPGTCENSLVPPSTTTASTTTTTPTTTTTTPTTTTTTPTTTTTTPTTTTTTPTTTTTTPTTTTPTTTTPTTTTTTPTTTTTTPTTTTPTTTTPTPTTTSPTTTTTAPTTTTPTTTTPTTTTTTPTTTNLPPGASYYCGFEQGHGCVFQNILGDNFDWTVDHSGPTKNKKTGPTNAYAGSQYAYIEVSGKQIDDLAVLSSIDTVLPASTFCLQFYYHMYGRHVGSLTVFTQERDSGLWFNDWDLSGNQGDQWSFASVEIPYHADLVIEFEASKGGTRSKGDIALDEITLTNNPC